MKRTNDVSPSNARADFDPILVEIVERKLDVYRKRLSPEMLDHFRQEALVLLSTHPYPAALLKQLQPPPIVEHTTSVPRADAVTASRNGIASSEASRGRAKPGRRGGV